MRRIILMWLAAIAVWSWVSVAAFESGYFNEQANGSISLGTPVTFSAPATISAYEPVELVIRRLPVATISVTIQSTTDPSRTLSFEYPRDCGSFGASGNPPVPNPPVCPNRDSSSEILALIDTLNTVNLSTRSLWRRVFDNLCADFPSKFPGGCTVQ